MSLQYRSNRDAFEIVCKIYHHVKGKRRGLEGINMTRIGQVDFSLTRSQTNSIMTCTAQCAERLRMREMGGGFIRDGKCRRRDPVHGKII